MSKNESTFTISINKHIHFYKKIIFDIKSHYKNIIYYYDMLDENGEITKTVKHNYENIPAELLYYNNQLKSIEYWVHGERHRKYGASVLTFNNREVTNEEWYQNGYKLTEIEVKSVKVVMERKKKMTYLMKKFKMK